jgi:hypothetical protein
MAQQTDCYSSEVVSKRNYLPKVEDNSAGQRNWKAIRLPARARGTEGPSHCGNFNPRNTLRDCVVFANRLAFSHETFGPVTMAMGK